MIERIIQASVRNPLLVIILTLIVAAVGVYALINTPIDAIPDLSENQVIVFADWPGRSPREIEDQVTYPLSVNLQGLAGVKAIRGTSEFGFSMVNIIFEDNVDFYFARERILERLSLAATFLPSGVTPYLAPDTTALGQIFWYTIEGEGVDPGRLRAIQDWYVRYQLYSVPGVAEVASVGGFPIEYQIDLDPNKLRAYDVTLGEVFSAVARSNSSVGGRIIQKGNSEYLVRSTGWINSLEDVEEIVVKSRGGTPVFVRQLGAVQFGSALRRASLEKNGSEQVGGVVLMRYGQNPLDVTRAIKQKLEQLQAGLPEGVRIVPFYERTSLIHRAIETVTGTLKEEMLIASLAVFLILWHVRSALIICITLPMAVLAAFILMHAFGIPSNIMSLSGIAISIGVLVDSSIVMVENATHQLYRKFGRAKVTGDTRDLVLPAMTTVGRPIFFSVMIMLISFIPVFALGGMEGKMFHPLAWTKTFAMVGVAILAITLVPALIPMLVRGRLRGEEESWIVRSVIEIYRPVLSYLLLHPWPIVLVTSIIFVFGAAPVGNRPLFLGVLAASLLAAWWAMRAERPGRRAVLHWAAAAAMLVLVGLMADSGMTRLGREFMPPLDEGTILDMPVTVPRASITQVADDLKARDAILRSFPEVEMVVGKAGRAETPTDPAPPDMIETIVSLRPREVWPKRRLRYDDAQSVTSEILEAMVQQGWIRAPDAAQRDALVNDATMFAMESFNETARHLTQTDFITFQHELGPRLTRATVSKIIRLLEEGNKLNRPVATDEVDQLAAELDDPFGAWLVESPDGPTIRRLGRELSRLLADAGAVTVSPDLMVLERSAIGRLLDDAAAVLGSERPDFFDVVLDEVQREREELWQQHVRQWNWELFDRVVPYFARQVVEQLRQQCEEAGLWMESAGEKDLRRLEAELAPNIAEHTMLWPHSKETLLEELDTATRVPGWGNIWTQPIINRVDMLATGVRTMIGVKVFGDDLKKIQEVSQQIADVLRKIPGAADVVPDQIVGEGYLEITIDRNRAARYGIRVADIQDTIEMALGGKVVTTTVEGRERFPVRIRNARAFREDEESVKNLLVSAASDMLGEMADAPPADTSGQMAERRVGEAAADMAPEPVMQVPLSQVADVRITEGPSMIKSENGLLRSYVQLNVRDRDIVGFVEEARQAVSQQVVLPPGMYIEWSGQFEHQLRAKRTLTIILPIVVVIIFLLLYVTYKDLADASLMMLAVPGAVAGGVLFQYLFGFSFSVAVWVGFIACFGLATETGVVMLVYLREAVAERGGLENMTLAELRQAVLEGAVHRLRPKLLTEGTTILALAPMLWASGTGAEIMRPMAAPVLGGILVADEVIDLLLPVLFYHVRARRWSKLHGRKIERLAVPAERHPLAEASA